MRQSVLHIDDVSGFDVIVGPNTGHSHGVDIFANAILIFENKRIVCFLNFESVTTADFLKQFLIHLKIRNQGL